MRFFDFKYFLNRANYEPAHVTDFFLKACLVAAAFPYVIFLYSTQSDLQPPALVLSFFFVILFSPSLIKITLPKKAWFILCILCMSSAFGILKALLEPTFTLRSALYYISIPVFYLVGICIHRQKTLNARITLIFAMIWFAVGFTQKYCVSDFGYFLIKLPRTTSNRGVLSLASEPSYYAIQCLFLMFINWAIYDPKNQKTHLATLAILLSQIVFFAKSFYGILLLSAFFAIWMIFYNPLTSFLVAPGIMSLILFFKSSIIKYALTHAHESRLHDLLSKFLMHPVITVKYDQSTNERVSHIIFSFYSVHIRPNINIGTGALDWESFINKNYHSFSFLKYALGGNRIMSGAGSAIFELGTLGILLVLSFLVPAINTNKKVIVLTLTLFSYILTAVPLAFPLFGILLGYLTVLGTSNGKLHLK